MDFRRKYRFVIEDESRLEKRVNVRANAAMIILFSVVFLICFFWICFFITVITPMKNILPGYLKESEREATEAQHLRLDSLVQVYEIQEAYLSGILSALEPSSDSINLLEEMPVNEEAEDSLLSISPEEREFIERIRERDKYNIAIASPADAETMMFGNLNQGGVISSETKDSPRAEILLPVGGSVSAVAEGKVISIASSPKSQGSYEVIIQHPKGFLSKTGKLNNLLVSQGDRVAQGQVIGGTSSYSGGKSNIVTFELWHDGNQLIPSRYLKER